MKKQKAGIPKSRCEVRLPSELDIRLDKIAAKAGTTRTQVVIAAIEKFIFDEETQIGVESLHERVAVLTVGQDSLAGEILEVRAYLDVLAQKVCGGKQDEFDRFLEAVDKVKFDLESAKQWEKVG